MPDYALTTTLTSSRSEAKTRVIDALQQEGFGILTEIDMQKTLAAKIGKDIEAFEILGACNPSLAHQAIEVDRSIGLLLPCNVVLRDSEAGVEVSFLDPAAMFSVVKPELREKLQGVVDEARQRLARALESLS